MKRRRRSIRPASALMVSFTLLSVFLLLWNEPALRLYISLDDDTAEVLNYATMLNEEEAARIRNDALEYARQFRQVSRRLAYAHIPKTAGTTLEKAAGEAGLAWGKCAFELVKIVNTAHYCPGHREDAPAYVGAVWHVPPYLWPLSNGHEPYAADVFTTVRDPVSRIVSEYHYLKKSPNVNATWFRRAFGDLHQGGVEGLVSRFLSSRQDNDSFDVGIRHYMRGHMHWIPQYDYVVGPLQVRTVEFVLPMSQLSRHFPRLLSAFGGSDGTATDSVTLPPERANVGSYGQEPVVLSPTVEDRIRRIYQKDEQLLQQVG